MIQRDIVRRLAHIKVKKATVTTEKRIRDILSDIEAVTQRPMHKITIRVME